MFSFAMVAEFLLELSIDRATGLGNVQKSQERVELVTATYSANKCLTNEPPIYTYLIENTEKLDVILPCTNKAN